MKKSLLKILSVIFSCLFVLSCSNLISGDNSGSGYNSFEKVNISGTIGVKGAVPSSIANARSLSAAINGRTAIPTIPEGADYYFFKTRDLDSGEVDNAAGLADSNGSYSVGLVIGRRYEVTAGISSDIDHENVLLTTSWETPLVTRENASSLGKDILLEPESEGTGTVFLLIKISASNISSVSCSNTSFEIIEKEGKKYLVQKGADIPGGAYEVTLTFKDSASTCLFYNTQTINVFPGMQTDKWVSGGGSLDPITSSGYEVTDALIAKFARTQIYVGTTSYGTAGSDGNGSSKSPFVSLQNAVSYITRMNDSSVDYTIWISGEVKGNSTIDSDVDGKAHSITISGTSGNTRDSLNGNNSGSVLIISTSVPVTIKNILITGGRASYGGSASYGGGINMDSGTNVILESGALIDGNYASESGGGIYSKGTLVLKAGSIVGRQSSTTATNSSYSNYATTGGGISFAGGTVTLEKDSVVSYNFAYQGGGIQCAFSSYSASYVLSITGAEIAYNGCDPKIRFSKDCSWSSYGGGIFANGCKFAASAINLHDNYGSDGGGGLFLQNCNSGEMTDCNIFDNTMHAGGYSEATDVLLFDACRLSLKDCQVSNKNNVSNGVKVRTDTSYLELKGSTVISSNTPVLLSSGTYITVSGNLTGTSPVATLTLESWKRGISVIKADETNISDLTTITDVTEKFKCTNELFSTVLSDDKKSLYLNAPIYVSENTPADTTKPEGSKEHPYTSISAASVEMNDKDTDYLIYIVGELRASQSLPTTLTKESHAKSITIKGYDTTASINGKLNTASPLIIKTNVPVTILNLTITEAKDSGVKITNSSAEVTLGTGAVITKNNNTVASNGGGIYNAGTLKILDGAVISDNHADSGKGGGIYNYFGTVIMEGGEISGNSANYGGGIYNYKEGDTITHDVIFEMKGGIVSGNTATNGGGAVYNQDIIKLSGSAYIPAGSNNSNDVYLIANKTINITAGITASSPAVTITLPADCYKADYQVLDPSGDLTQYKKIRLSTTGPWELNSSGNLQYKIADALQTMSSVNVALSSDLTIVPHSSYEAGSFTNGGKRYALIVPEGKTLTLSAKSGSPVISPSVRCGGFIKVKGTLIIDGVTLSPGSASLHWDAIEIDENGTVELRSGSIEGFSCYGASYGAVHVYNGGSFIMSGGTIKNNSSHGGVTVASGGIFTISGGSITENTSSSGYGGGVTVESGATFTQTGGSVTGNTGGNSEILRK